MKHVTELRFEQHPCKPQDITQCTICLNFTETVGHFRHLGYACEICHAVACVPCFEKFMKYNNHKITKCFICKNATVTMRSCVVCSAYVDVDKSALYRAVLKCEETFQLGSCTNQHQLVTCAKAVNEHLKYQIMRYNVHMEPTEFLLTHMTAWITWFNAVCLSVHGSIDVSAEIHACMGILNVLHKHFKWTYSVGCVCTTCEADTDSITYCSSCMFLVDRSSVVNGNCSHCRNRFKNQYNPRAADSPTPVHFVK